MRKIKSEYENPIDDVLLDCSEYVSPTFYDYGFTPNMVTTLSNISAILVIILLLKANYVWASIFFMIAYFFDCLDGHLARKYGMTSEFGDYYDHVSDGVKFILIMATLYYINKEKFYIVIPIILLSVMLSGIHFGCQQLLYNNGKFETLNFTQGMCPTKNLNNPEDVKRTIRMTRWVGPGTSNVIISLCILYYGL